VIESFAILSLQCRRIAAAALAALCGSIALIQPIAAATGQSDGRASYVLLTAGSQSSTMSGSTDDLRRARALRVGREGLFYVRQNGVAYVIRDAATLRRAEAIFEPQQALGARQAELGSRQAALGSRQAALGAEQARLGARQAGASPRHAEEFARQQSELGRQQDALGGQQEALGRQQEALGREQDRLGRQTQGSLRMLVEEAIQRGVAQRMR
jgi:bla regulator protein BlaR1